MANENKQRRLTTEKTVNNSDFRLKIGTVNKSNPQVIYVEGRTFISPLEEEDNYTYYIQTIRKNFSGAISKELSKTKLFEDKFILDFQVANSGIRKGKKSFLSFQFLLKQPYNEIKQFKEIKSLSSQIMNNIVSSLKTIIIDNGFALSKSKKENVLV